MVDLSSGTSAPMGGSLFAGGQSVQMPQLQALAQLLQGIRSGGGNVGGGGQQGQAQPQQGQNQQSSALSNPLMQALGKAGLNGVNGLFAAPSLGNVFGGGAVTNAADPLAGAFGVSGTVGNAATMGMADEGLGAGGSALTGAGGTGGFLSGLGDAASSGLSALAALFA